MGCDIHWVVEQRHGDKWVGVYATDCLIKPPIHVWQPERAIDISGQDYMELHSVRSYAFFARLAGIRGDGPAPIGLPDDRSDLARMYLDGDSDLHSLTWMSVDEFV